MGLYVGCVVLDARDMKRAMEFWKVALGYEATSVADDWILLSNPARRWAGLGLQPNPDPKRETNRVHLDLWTSDLNGEVRRLESLGAKRVPWEYPEGGTPYVVLEDTEGNEFCVVAVKRPPDDPPTAPP